MEMWRSVVGFEHAYEVSSLGNVRSIDRTVSGHYLSSDGKFQRKGRPMKTHLNFRGYPRVTLRTKDQKDKTIYVHRLVAEAFVFNPDPKNKTYVNHIDGNKLNNTPENLEWTTNAENMKHAYDTGLKDRYYVSKFSKTKKIAQYTVDGEFLKEYNSIKEAADATGAKSPNIHHALTGMYKTSAGFIWKYV